MSQFLQKTMPSPSFQTVNIPAPGMPNAAGDPLGSANLYWGQFYLNSPIAGVYKNPITNRGELYIVAAPGVPNGVWLNVQTGLTLRGMSNDVTHGVNIEPDGVPAGPTSLLVRRVNATVVDTHGGQTINGSLAVSAIGINKVPQGSGPPIPDAVTHNDAITSLNLLLAFLRLRGDILP